jgi:hypothetical protein
MTGASAPIRVTGSPAINRCPRRSAIPNR